MSRPGLSIRRALPVTCLLATLLAGACNEAFAPLQESSSKRFSIFGYLDASADTQWIRVMPIRPLRQTSPDSFGMTVTLENVATGASVELRDSLFAFTSYAGTDLGSGTQYVHDYWTTQKIEPGATYRFSARLDTGEAAEALVKIPADYAVELWLAPSSSNHFVTRDSDYLRITGLKHLPFVGQAEHFTDGCGPGVDTVWYKAKPGSDGSFEIPIARTTVPPRGEATCGTPVVKSRDLWLVGSDSVWPAGDQYSIQGLGRSELTSNVANAVGFLGGVLSKDIPYEQCALESGGQLVDSYCKLRYDQASASLRGTVTETRCGGGPIDQVTLTLTELDHDPSEVRTYVTPPEGTFYIDALVPDTRYALKARAKPVPVFGKGEIDEYSIGYDTLTFAPGEHRTYDIGLQKLIPCDQNP